MFSVEYYGPDVSHEPMLCITGLSAEGITSVCEIHSRSE